MVRHNQQVIDSLPEAVALMAPPKDRIVRVHKTNRDAAENIVRVGYKFEGYVGNYALSNTTSTLVHAGSEVAPDWSDDDVRSYNRDVLAGTHRDADCVVVLSLPDPIQGNGLPTAKADPDNLKLDGASRQGPWHKVYDEYLDKLLIDPKGQGLVAPPMVLGFIDRTRAEFVANPVFDPNYNANRS